MRAKSKAKARKPVKRQVEFVKNPKVVFTAKVKPLKYTFTCPHCRKTVAMKAYAMPALPKCPSCQTTLTYDTTLGTYRCPKCGKIICPQCIVVMTLQTDGRYRCPKCGYLSNSPSGS